MRKIRKILFAGYPHNAERLYKIVDAGTSYVPTEEEFNEMLIPLPHLTEAFPDLVHHIFTVGDRYNQKHLAVLRKFIQDVNALRPDKKTSNGLTYQDIVAMPFYKAANCLIYETENPMETFAQLYPNDYFMSESQAYDSTQHAIWRLLNDYGVEDNNFSDIEHDGLAKILIQYAEHGFVLKTEPEYAEIRIDGDLKFSYNPQDGKWYTDWLTVIEPPNYHGVYDMNLPEGVTLLDSKLSHIYGNQPYKLVSNREIKEGEIFTGTVNYYWMADCRQYIPMGGGKFQDMIGAVVRGKNMNISVRYGTNALGDLKISKTVAGEEADQKQEFPFTLTLDCPINGPYGGLTFANGVANFTLKHGESKTIKTCLLELTIR